MEAPLLALMTALLSTVSQAAPNAGCAQLKSEAAAFSRIQYDVALEDLDAAIREIDSVKRKITAAKTENDFKVAGAALKSWLTTLRNAISAGSLVAPDRKKQAQAAVKLAKQLAAGKEGDNKKALSGLERFAEVISEVSIALLGLQDLIDTEAERRRIEKELATIEQRARELRTALSLAKTEPAIATIYAQVVPILVAAQCSE